MVDFDGNNLKIRGMARIDFFRVHGAGEEETFESLVALDSGQTFLEFLLKQPASASFDLRRAATPGWFVGFDRIRAFDNIDGLVFIDEVPADPGPFHAEIDAFNFRQIDHLDSVFDKASEFRNYIKSFAGIRVYRDGFGIRVPDDWLELRKGWTSATSYYGLKPENTLGFVRISSRDNAQLLETTNREAFTDTPFYQNFRAILQKFIRFSGEAQGFVRRGWNEFKKSSIRNSDGRGRRRTTEHSPMSLKRSQYPPKTAQGSEQNRVLR